jgi:hypothetical protein
MYKSIIIKLIKKHSKNIEIYIILFIFSVYYTSLIV